MNSRITEPFLIRPRRGFMRYWFLYEFIRLFSLASLASLLRTLTVICLVVGAIGVSLRIWTGVETLTFSVMLLGATVMLYRFAAFPGRIGEIFENAEQYNQPLVSRLREYREIVTSGTFDRRGELLRPVTSGASSRRVASISMALVVLNTVAFVLIVRSSLPMHVRLLGGFLLLMIYFGIAPRLYRWSRNPPRRSLPSDQFRPKARRRR